MRPILCKFCKQYDCVNNDLCKQFYIYMLNEKVKKLRALLDMLLKELEKL